MFALLSRRRRGSVCALAPLAAALVLVATPPRSALAAIPQTTTNTDTATAARARALSEQGQWEDAAAAWQEVVAADAGDGEAWFQLGTARLRAGDAEGALTAFEKAKPAGGPEYLLPLRSAVAAATLGRAARALDLLTAAVEAGLPPGVLSGHEGLASLRQALAGEARFQEMLTADERRAHPCLHDPAYRELDFWAGEWDVVASGSPVGHNRIDRILDGCALLENWDGSGGGNGKSFNYRDPATGRWHQHWVSASGNTIDFEGGLDAAGAMRLEGRRNAPDGESALTRMALIPLPDGEVRQLIEESEDGGATWEVGFDAVYRPTETAAGGGGD